eukprot:354450-Chlamydomonas_euryale.AAC.3
MAGIRQQRERKRRPLAALVSGSLLPDHGLPFHMWVGDVDDDDAGRLCRLWNCALFQRDGSLKVACVPHMGRHPLPQLVQLAEQFAHALGAVPPDNGHAQRHVRGGALGSDAAQSGRRGLGDGRAQHRQGRVMRLQLQRRHRYSRSRAAVSYAACV